MFLAGTNFTMIYFGLVGRFRKVIRNDEFKAYAIAVFHENGNGENVQHKKITEDNTSNFFEPVVKIFVVSLFFTGELNEDKSNYHNLLNKSVTDKNFDFENDHEEDRIQFHFVSHIRVQECPYNKNNYKTDCIIVSEGLCGIHKFYTEKK